MVLTRRGRSYETSVEPELPPKATPKAAAKPKAKPASAAAPKAATAENKRTRRTRATKPDEASPLRSLDNLPRRNTNRVTKKKAAPKKQQLVIAQAQVDETPDEDEPTGLFFDIEAKRMRMNRYDTGDDEQVKPDIQVANPSQTHPKVQLQLQPLPDIDSQAPRGFQPAHSQPQQIQDDPQQLQSGSYQVHHPPQNAQDQSPVHVPAWHRVRFQLQGMSPSQHQAEFLKLKQQEEAQEQIDLHRPQDPTNVKDWAIANATLRHDLDKRDQEIDQLRRVVATKDYFLNNAIAENNILKAENARLRRGHSPTPTPEVQNDPLLNKIIKARDEGRAAQYIKEKPQEQEVIVNGINGVDEEPEEMDTTADATPLEFASTSATPMAANQSATSVATTWGLSSLFTKVASVFGSPAKASPGNAPATAPQGSTLAPQVIEEIGLALAPEATPTRPPKRRPQPKTKTTKKSRNSDSARRAIVNKAVKGVQANQKEVAEAWAKKIASKITIDDGKAPQPGMKRQALEQKVRIKDVKEIPARRPWESTGSYGLLNEFFDNSDSDSDSDEREVPGWYVVDTLAKEQPPLKKRKTGSDASSINNTQSSLMTSPLSDTLGNSASLLDLHPRPAHIPSPMFDNPVTHHDGGNVFEERQTQSLSAEDRAAFEKKLRKTGHVEGSGTFCVPESDSDDDDDDDEEPGHDSNAENAAGSLPWTQAPPAAPTPAHAKLPVPVTASPSVPEIQSAPKTETAPKTAAVDSLETAPKTVAVDPLETARARLMKHTPAKPSRLREAMVPSPSPRSDTSLSPAVAAAAAQAQTISAAVDIPGVVPLDLGNSQLLNSARSWTESAEFKDHAGKMFGGGNVTLVYDGDEDVNDQEL